MCVRSKEGVKNALSMTIPLGEGIHRRMVYVELEDGYKLEDVTKAIKADPYFANDEKLAALAEKLNADAPENLALAMKEKIAEKVAEKKAAAAAAKAEAEAAAAAETAGAEAEAPAEA